MVVLCQQPYYWKRHNFYRKSHDYMPDNNKNALTGKVPVFAKAGKLKQRMKWTTKMNKNVMLYLNATKLESDMTIVGIRTVSPARQQTSTEGFPFLYGITVWLGRYPSS